MSTFYDYSIILSFIYLSLKYRNNISVNLPTCKHFISSEGSVFFFHHTIENCTIESSISKRNNTFFLGFLHIEVDCDR